MPASAEPNWVETGTKWSSSIALRIVHGATVSAAASTSTTGRRLGPRQTATASGNSRMIAFARPRIASPISTPGEQRPAAQRGTRCAPSMQSTDSGSDITDWPTRISGT